MADPLPVLYQAEWCPFSSAVREVLTELGVDFVARQVQPWPEQRGDLRQLADTDQIPVLQTENGRLFPQPALDIAADPHDRRHGLEQLGRLPRPWPERCVVTAEYMGSHALGVCGREHGLERRQVAVDVVEQRDPGAVHGSGTAAAGRLPQATNPEASVTPARISARPATLAPVIGSPRIVAP